MSLTPFQWVQLIEQVENSIIEFDEGVSALDDNDIDVLQECLDKYNKGVRSDELYLEIKNHL